MFDRLFNKLPSKDVTESVTKSLGNLEVLPVEILQLILSKLKLKDKIHIAKICKILYEILKNDKDYKQALQTYEQYKKSSKKMDFKKIRARFEDKLVELTLPIFNHLADISYSQTANRGMFFDHPPRMRLSDLRTSEFRPFNPPR